MRLIDWHALVHVCRNWRHLFFNHHVVGSATLLYVHNPSEEGAGRLVTFTNPYGAPKCGTTVTLIFFRRLNTYINCVNSHCTLFQDVNIPLIFSVIYLPPFILITLLAPKTSINNIIDFDCRSGSKDPVPWNSATIDPEWTAILVRYLLYNDTSVYEEK